MLIGDHAARSQFEQSIKQACKFAERIRELTEQPLGFGITMILSNSMDT